LNYNHGDRDQMYQPKPGVSDPIPPKGMAHKYQYKAEYDKSDKQYVQQQDYIRGHLIYG
jgi:hypothetical protein